MGSNKSIFQCPRCKKTSERAKIFPCGGYCIDCVEELLKSFETDRLKSESVKKLKSHLKMADSNIEDFENDVNISYDSIMEHCLNLRNQVQLETEILIKKVHDFNEEKINDIDEYEKKLLASFKHKKEPTFIQEMKIFRDNWGTYLENQSIQSIEIQNANNLGENICSRLKTEKAKLNLSFFGGSKLEFCKNPDEITSDILGNFVLRNSINLSLNPSKKLDIKKLLPDLDRTKQRPIFELFDNQKFCVGYKDATGFLNVALIDENLVVNYRFRTSDICFNGFGLLTNKTQILVWQNGQSGNRLTKLSFDLKIVKEKILKLVHLKKKKMSANDSIICLLDNDKIKVFDWDLNFLIGVGQSLIKTGLYYILDETKINGFFLNGQMLYVLYSGRMDIMNIETGVKMRSIQMKADKLRLDSNENLIFWSKKESKMTQCTKEGFYSNSFNVDQDIIDFIIFKTGNILLLK